MLLRKHVSGVSWKGLKKDFGGVGDDTADDGPALQALLDDAANQGGLYEIEPGTYRIKTPVARSYLGGEQVTIFGHGSQSVIKVGIVSSPNTTDGIFVGFGGVVGGIFRFQDVAFLGIGTAPIVSGTQARDILSFQGSTGSHFIVSGIQMCGCQAKRTLIHCAGSNHKLDSITITACVSVDVFGLVWDDQNSSFDYGNFSFEDLGTINGISFGGTFASYSIISSPNLGFIGSPVGDVGPSSNTTIHDGNTDESPIYQFFAYGLAARGDHYRVDNCYMSVSSVGGSAGVFLYNYELCRVIDCRTAYTPFARNAIEADFCGAVTVDHLSTEIAHTPSANTITANASTRVVTAIDCTNVIWPGGASAAAVTLEHKDGGLKKSVTGGAFGTIY
jgi:hypothetical protein